MTSGVVITEEDFLVRLNAKHNGKIVSIAYGGWSKKSTFHCTVCRKSFTTMSSKVVNKTGCPFCAGRHRTIKEVVDLSRNLYGDKFDFRDTVFTKSKDRFKVVCRDCGNTLETSYSDLIAKVKGCRFCKGRYDDYAAVFTQRAALVHNNKYDYSLVEYLNSSTKVKIICPEHGLFEQTPAGHLSTKGCPDCGNINRGKSRASSTAQFVEKAKAVHGDKYCYNNSSYVSANSRISIFCNTCQLEFSQTCSDHLSGYGCQRCAGVYKRTVEDFIKDSKEKFGDKFDYSSVLFKNIRERVELVCKDCSTTFSTSPLVHLRSSVGACPSCCQSGYRVSKTGVLYVLKSGNITKVGITNRTAQIRCNDINKSSGKDFRVIHQIKFSNGAIPQNIERNILSYLRLTYQPVDECYDGSTECFLDVNYDDLLLHVRHEHLKQLKEQYGT